MRASNAFNASRARMGLSFADTRDSLLARIGQKDPKFCKQGDSVLVRIKMSRSVCVEKYKDFSQMGRFMLRDQGNTIGVGIINELKYPEDKKKSEGDAK
jgi:translation elongation factor EF-1alpha